MKQLISDSTCTSYRSWYDLCVSMKKYQWAPFPNVNKPITGRMSQVWLRSVYLHVHDICCMIQCLSLNYAGRQATHVGFGKQLLPVCCCSNFHKFHHVFSECSNCFTPSYCMRCIISHRFLKKDLIELLLQVHIFYGNLVYWYTDVEIHFENSVKTSRNRGFLRNQK